MAKLILNENMKIYRRWGPWVMVSILVMLTILISLIIHSFTPIDSADWKEDAQRQIREGEQWLKDGPMPQGAVGQRAIEQMEDHLKVTRYRLEHNIPPENSTWWGMVKQMSALISLITIFTVIVAGGIVAREFSGGTIKLLLVRPVRRWKILLSKYIASFLFSLFWLLILFTVAIVVNALLYGIRDLGLPHLYVDRLGNVAESSLLLHTLGTYGLASVQLIMIVSLAFMISAVFRSSAFAIGFSIVLMFVGDTVTQFLSRFDWARFILFANTNLAVYLDGTPPMEGMTMPFSIAVLLVYFILFNALSWTVFTRRDVTS